MTLLALVLVETGRHRPLGRPPNDPDLLRQYNALLADSGTLDFDL